GPGLDVAGAARRQFDRAGRQRRLDAAARLGSDAGDRAASGRRAPGRPVRGGTLHRTRGAAHEGGDLAVRRRQWWHSGVDAPRRRAAPVVAKRARRDEPRRRGWSPLRIRPGRGGPPRLRPGDRARGGEARVRRWGGPLEQPHRGGRADRAPGGELERSLHERHPGNLAAAVNAYRLIQYDSFTRKLLSGRRPNRSLKSPRKLRVPSTPLEPWRPWLQTTKSVEPGRYSQRNTTLERNCL